MRFQWPRYVLFELIAFDGGLIASLLSHQELILIQKQVTQLLIDHTDELRRFSLAQLDYFLFFLQYCPQVIEKSLVLFSAEGFTSLLNLPNDFKDIMGEYFPTLQWLLGLLDLCLS